MARRTLNFPLRTFAIAATVLALPAALAASALASSLIGSVSAAGTSPARTLELSAPHGVRVTVPRVHVSENGKSVADLSVTSVAPAARSEFGIVLVIDQSQSMQGAPLARAMAAARAIAAQRTGKQKLAVITYDFAPTVVQPMTSSSRRIHRALGTTPWPGVPGSPLPAVMAALTQLSDAQVADGAVILISDGADAGATSLTTQSVAAAAHAQHAQIYTVGVGGIDAKAGQLSSLTNGTSAAITGARLPRVFTHLVSAVPRSYLITYKSPLAGGQHIAVSVQVDGVSEPLQLSYDAPAPAAPSSGTPSSGATAPSGSTSPASTPSGSTSSGAAVPASSTPSGATPSAPKSAGGTTGGSAASHTKALHTPTVIRSKGVSIVLRPLPTRRGAPTHRASKARHTPSRPTLTPAPSAPGPASGWIAPAPRHSFWNSSLSVVAIAAGCALLLALGVALLLYRRPTRRALQKRVGTFTHATPEADPGIAGLGAATGSPIERLLTRRRWWPVFAQKVETARMRRSALGLVRRWALITLVAAVLVDLILGSIIYPLLLLVISPFALRAWVSRGARRQQRAFNQDLPGHLQDLAGSMRAGRSFVGAISAMVESATEPVRGEFERALSDERLGLPLEDTLEAIGQRMIAPDMEQVALIAGLNRNSGSNVAEALERVAESSRDRADLQREMRALTGQARMSAYVLTGMPPVMLVALMVIAPKYQRPLFHTTIGIILLGVAAGMLAAGWFVMSKIANPEV